MTFPRGLIATVLALALLPVFAPIAMAQGIGVVQSEILVLDPERLFEETRLGKRMLAEHQEKREQLAARNRKLEAELEAEEKRLTEQRDETSPEEFRDLADAFDSKVQQIRRDSERRARDLERERERLPLAFLRSVEPVLTEVMQKAGGVVVLDARTVLFRADVVDVTDAAIARIDEVIGKGPETLPEPGRDAEQ
ncbi:OmpH family outer membrane protein [Roseovarius salis]|uniref:OmpH family outer membrane protein n=1 Tax=Roseovarius salis TaxID=3376063 RepID=UPI0037C66BB6